MNVLERPVRYSPLPEPEEALRRQADEILRLYGEFTRRLSNHGVRGVLELVDLHAQVVRAADAIAMQEIDFALTQIGDLMDRIRLIGARLDQLGEIRRTLEEREAAAD